jgi:AAHS family 4-hydroxybenzoate transporter-like MFS transporter
MPLALAPVLFAVLPESLRFLVARGDAADRIAATLRRIEPSLKLAAGVRFTGAHKAAGLPVRQLLQGGVLVGTLFLWSTFFMSLLVVYLLSSWLPTLIHATGASLQTAALVTAMFQVGGTVGAVALGRLMDRFDPHAVLGMSYALAGLFIAATGAVAATPWLIAVTVFGAGFCISGSQVGANALAAAYYPTSSRATGVSWANGVGRSGSVVGSMVGGAMLSAGLGLDTVFAIVAVPAVLAGVSIYAMGQARRRQAAAAMLAAEAR